MSEPGAQPTTLIRTKLQKPQVSRNLVVRPQLLGRLDRGQERTLTLVSAPAGYGKTTLLGAWLEKCSVSSAWVTLDQNDNEIASFLSYFIAAIRAVAPDACSNTETLLSALQQPSPEYLTNSLIEEILDLREPVCLALDDYHVIHQKDIHQLVLDLVRLRLSQLHLVIATRHDPTFSLSRLRGTRQLTEIRANDLRFSSQEAQQFLEQQLGVQIEPALAAKLVERTEGWAVGLYMAALAMRGQDDYAAFAESFRGSQHYVTSYLIDEVFAHQPQAIRTFLLRTSILDRFCAPLCDAVVDGRSAGGARDSKPSNGAEGALPSQEILEQLEKSNLFVVPLDEQREWFRYHHLFQDLLVHRLKTETIEAKTAALHCAAGAWFEQNGFVEEALHHFLTANDTQAAAEVVAGHRWELMNWAQWQRLEAWLRLFSPEVQNQFPDLLMLRAWLLYHRGKFAELPASLNRLETVLDQASLNRQVAGHLEGEISALRSLVFYFAVDPKNSLIYAKQAIEKTSPELWIVRLFARMYLRGALQMAGDLDGAYRAIYSSFEEEQVQGNRFTAVLLTTVCQIHWLAADLHSLAQTAGQCLAFSQSPYVPEIMAWGHYHKGCIDYHHNSLAEAEDHFATVVRQPHLSYGLCFAHSAFGLAMTYQAQGRPDEARAVAESAVSFLLKTGNTSLLPVAQSFQVELGLIQGHVAVAGQWADRLDPEFALTPLVLFYSWHLTPVKAWLAQDTPASRQRADNLLNRLREFVEFTHNTRFLIDVLALQALHHKAMNDMPDARPALEQAIDLAQPGGFIRPFVDLGPNMAGLLADLRPTDSRHNEYIDQILSAFSLQDDTPRSLITSRNGQLSLAEPLTDREMDVLAHLAARRSNKEIASQLVISLNTVATHTRNIFTKLDVHNRRQAVVRARELGLLSSE